MDTKENDEDDEEMDLKTPPTLCDALNACEILSNFCNFNNLNENQNFNVIYRDLETRFYFDRCSEQTKITDFISHQ